MKNTETQEMYLVTIYRLSKRLDVVRNVDICVERDYVKSTVHAGLKDLEKKGLITNVDGDIRLTESGLAVAKDIEAKHRILVDAFIMIGIDEAEAEDNACRVEHAISDNVAQHLYAYLEEQNKRISNLEQYYRYKHKND